MVVPTMTSVLKAIRSEQRSFYICSRCLRQFATSSSRQSGHSRWSTIKHDKGRADAEKSKQRAIIAKELSDASKMSGSDPAINPRLADAISKSKRAGFPKSGIEVAIARGQGKSATGATLENVTVEAVVPPVAMILECETESKARALQEIRTILKTAGAQPTPTAYLFEKRGRLVFDQKDGVGMDDILDIALEAGAVDVTEDEDGRLVIDTEVATLKAVEQALKDSHDFELASSDTIWLPNPETAVREIEEEPLALLLKLRNDLEDYPGVQAVYMNADLDVKNAGQTVTA